MEVEILEENLIKVSINDFSFLIEHKMKGLSNLYLLHQEGRELLSFHRVSLNEIKRYAKQEKCKINELLKLLPKEFRKKIYDISF